MELKEAIDTSRKIISNMNYIEARKPLSLVLSAAEEWEAHHTARMSRGCDSCWSNKIRKETPSQAKCKGCCGICHDKWTGEDRWN
jgi:hypothetical protein